MRKKPRRPNARRWLVDIREIEGYTQSEVAQKSGISPSYYAFIETGTRNLKPDVAKRIAAFLGFEWTKFYPDAPEDVNEHNTGAVTAGS